MDIDTMMAIVNRANQIMDRTDEGLGILETAQDVVASRESVRKHISTTGALEQRRLAQRAIEQLGDATRASHRAGDVVREALELKATKDLQAKMLRGSVRELMPSVPRIKGGKILGPDLPGNRAYRLAPSSYSSIADKVSGKKRLIKAIDQAGLSMIDSASGVSKQHRKAARAIDAVDALKGSPINAFRRGKNLGKAILSHEFLGSPLYRSMANRAHARKFEALAKSGAKGLKNPEVVKAIRGLDSSISPIRVVGNTHDVSRNVRSKNTVYSPRTPPSKVPGAKSAGKSFKAAAKGLGKGLLKSAPIIGGIDDLGLVYQDIQEGDWRGGIAHTADAILDTVGIGAIVNLGFNLGSEHTGFFDWAIGEGTESGSDGLGTVWSGIKGIFD